MKASHHLSQSVKIFFEEESPFELTHYSAPDNSFNALKIIITWSKCFLRLICDKEMVMTRRAFKSKKPACGLKVDKKQV